MNISRFRLITFDVTDTLLKFRLTPEKQYAQVAAMYGILVDSKSLAASFQSCWRQMNINYPNYGKYSDLGWETWWKELIKGTFKDANINLDEKKLDAVATHLILIYQDSIAWYYAYGALGLLSYLRSGEIPMGVISNFDPSLHKILVNTKIRHYFRFLAGSYELGVAKPDCKIFEKAMELSKIDGIKPDDCLHVGNTASLDYMGAKNSGWNAVLIQSKKDLQKVKAKYPCIETSSVFDNLRDLHIQFLVNSGHKLGV